MQYAVDNAYREAAATGMANGKPTFMASASGSAKKLVHIGNLSRDVLSKFGGRGGGKENFARGTFPEEVAPEVLFKEIEIKLKELI